MRARCGRRGSRAAEDRRAAPTPHGSENGCCCTRRGVHRLSCGDPGRPRAPENGRHAEPYPMEDQMSSTHPSDEAASRTRRAGIGISPGLKDAWRRGQRGWPAGRPVVQFPNPPLIVAATGLLVSMVTTGSVADYGRATFYAGLAAWAWLEL